MQASFRLAASVIFLTCLSKLRLVSNVTPSIVHSVLNVKAVPRYSRLMGGGGCLHVDSVGLATKRNPYVLVAFAFGLIDTLIPYLSLQSEIVSKVS